MAALQQLRAPLLPGRRELAPKHPLLRARECRRAALPGVPGGVPGVPGVSIPGIAGVPGVPTTPPTAADVEKLGSVLGVAINDVIAQFDTNRDGLLTIAEAVAAYAAIQTAQSQLTPLNVAYQAANTLNPELTASATANAAALVGAAPPGTVPAGSPPTSAISTAEALLAAAPPGTLPPGTPTTAAGAAEAAATALIAAAPPGSVPPEVSSKVVAAAVSAAKPAPAGPAAAAAAAAPAAAATTAAPAPAAAATAAAAGPAPTWELQLLYGVLNARRRGESAFAAALSYIGNKLTNKGKGAATASDLVWSALGMFLAVAALGVMNLYVKDWPVVGEWHQQGLGLLLGSFGTLCVLIFGRPEAEAVRVWNLLAGHVIATATVLSLLHVLGPSVLSRSLAMAVMIGAMLLTDSVHPPGGALVLMAVDSAAIQRMDWWFMLYPSLAFTLALLLPLGAAVNWLKRNVKFDFPSSSSSSAAAAPPPPALKPKLA